MDVLKVAICCAETDYSLALGEALSDLHNNLLITVFDGAASCADDAFDLLLLGAECANGAGSFTQDAGGADGLARDAGGAENPPCGADGLAAHFADSKKVIELVDTPAEAGKDLDALRFKLFKYASAKELASDIFLFDSLLTGKKRIGIRKENTRLIALCGSAGGVGQTTVSMGLGQSLCRYHGKKALVVSFEEFESTLQFMNKRDDGLSIGEYLYYLFKNRSPLDLESFLLWDRYGVRAFNPDKGKNRLKELNIEQLAVFFDAIASDRFEYVLIDMGECFSAAAAWVLQQCDKIIAITADPEENERELRFLTYLRFLLGRKAESDLIRVRNRVSRSPEYEEDESELLLIDYDPESVVRKADANPISIDQGFGSGIKALSKKIT